MFQPRLRSLAPARQNYIAASNPQLPRRQNVSRACIRCQSKKTKCFGGIPCQRCIQTKTPCVVDEDSDERRKILIKRRLSSLEKDRELLIQLMEALREEDRLHISVTMNLIRSDATIDDLRSFMTDQDEREVSKEHSPCAEKSETDVQTAPFLTPSARQYLMNIQRLTDIPVHRVPAHPWTSVTNDNDFVSHLISLYFLLEHQALNWIDQDLFLEAMKSGKLESEFCSPLLVNSILSVACWISNWPEAMATEGDPTSKGLHFYNEARDLLSQQEGRVSLTSVQGLAALYTSSCMMGKDRLGWKYLVEIGDSTRQILARRSHLIAKAEHRQEMRRALDTAVLGLFSLTSTATLMLQQPLVMKKPDLGPFLPDHKHDDTWMPYPLIADPVRGQMNCVKQASFDLQSIIFNIPAYFFKEHGPSHYPDVENTVDSFYRDLRQWSLHIPECITLECESTPDVMDMHMKYHAANATIFGFIKHLPDEEMPMISIDHARYLRHSAAQHIRDILSSHRSRWSTNLMPLNYAQYANLALFILLEGLDDDKSAEAFVDLCIILCALSRRWLLAKGMLRLVQLTAQLKGIALPPETSGLFHEFTSQTWKLHERKRFSSLYPNVAITVLGEKNLGEAELDLFLARWDDLDLSKDMEDGEEYKEDDTKL
ncbi:uncharacterized protein KD926_011151 [Aspergillus affinis]|uniref:uncharacterized protein n=1 Tax=Aspergillus affinis TaxID=1070780 RepID=UPI0022FE9CF7|nr:uncharacterized protein KD926_011151 [Aspergillus affinis]KAI9038212.1 hypothetical protein KD926_011151 [Aspergillus affinis]